LNKRWQNWKEIKMPDLPQKKVGIVTCSGEELPEGTVTRLAALRVLEQLRPGETVTICLPLFLAGGEGDRAFAKFYPTIAIDGCEKRCAYHGTARYSNEPAASLVITDLVKKHGLSKPEGLRKLNEAGQQAVEIAANEMAAQVDTLLGKSWNRTNGEIEPKNNNEQPEETTTATCSCGSGIPITILTIRDQKITVVGLPLIFETFQSKDKAPSIAALDEIMEMVKIYNRIDPKDESILQAEIQKEYETYYQKNKK
jgi:uncharacterized metal-binding protein